MTDDRMPVVHPGTVSKILWHFPGGPPWDPEKKRKEEPKPREDAYEFLKGILESRELRVGVYRESAFQVKRPPAEQGGMLAAIIQEIPQPKVACLADIPIQHLAYHANRYNRFAIGFRRESAREAGFRPVHYVLHDDFIIEQYHGTLDFLIKSVCYLEKGLQDTTNEERRAKEDRIGALKKARENHEKSLAFVKTFGPQEFNTIYCEREWRSIKPFVFKPEDVVMATLPQEFVPRLRQVLQDLGASIPVVSWEDLVEH